LENFSSALVIFCFMSYSLFILFSLVETNFIENQILCQDIFVTAQPKVFESNGNT